MLIHLLSLLLFDFEIFAAKEITFELVVVDVAVIELSDTNVQVPCKAVAMPVPVEPITIPLSTNNWEKFVD